VEVFPLSVHREEFPNRERYYRLEVPSRLHLLGKTTLYITAVTSDEDLLDLFRVGHALALAGSRRRIFIIPYLAYAIMDRATKPGEVVTAKSNSQMMAALARSDESSVFLFLDLHDPCLLHYFEGPCLRVNFSAKYLLLDKIRKYHHDLTNVVVGSTNLRHANWVNWYANELNVPIVFLTESRLLTEGIEYQAKPMGIVGDVKGKYVVIYDDIIRSGRSIAGAVALYLESGAIGVDVVVSHLTCFEEAQIQALAELPIGVLIATNSHPATQSKIIVDNPTKFDLVNVIDIFAEELFMLVPVPGPGGERRYTIT
jgi:ribose-phosphate pyrophosphokinase